MIKMRDIHISVILTNREHDKVGDICNDLFGFIIVKIPKYTILGDINEKVCKRKICRAF